MESSPWSRVFPYTYTVWNVFKYGVFSGPYFPAFGLNTVRYFVSLHIQSKCGKVRTRKNSVFVHFSRSDIQVTKMITLSFGKFIHEMLQLLVICKVKVSVSSTVSSILSSFSLKRLTYEGLTSGNFLENPKLRRTFFSNFTGLICRNLEYLLQI